jgi:hypothetical protein
MIVHTGAAPGVYIYCFRIYRRLIFEFTLLNLFKILVLINEMDFEK